MAFNPQEHLMDLKGKSYLQVMWRLVWFREEHPDWRIKTDLVAWDKEAQHAIFKAEILDPADRALSTGYGSESVKDFRDYLEKAETKAVGRALAMLGYGTQFAPELDEEERIVDSPVPKKEAKKPAVQQLVKRKYPADKITPDEANNLARELQRMNVNIDMLLQREQVTKLIDLKPEQYMKIMGQIDAAKREKEQSDSGTGSGGPGSGDGVRAGSKTA